MQILVEVEYLFAEFKVLWLTLGQGKSFTWVKTVVDHGGHLQEVR